MSIKLYLKPGPDFPAFGRGLSLRLIEYAKLPDRRRAEFPRLRAGTFIEAVVLFNIPERLVISPPSGGDFH